jgi:hypothetical protein
MGLYLLLLMTGALVIEEVAAAASPNCSYTHHVAAGQTSCVVSPNFPRNYSNGTDCRWEAVAPSNSKLNISCYVSIPEVSE